MYGFSNLQTTRGHHTAHAELPLGMMGPTEVNQPNEEEAVPLRIWLEGEIKKEAAERREEHSQKSTSQLSPPQLSILRKTTVSYAVAELLRRSITSAPLSADKISIDNFAVRKKKPHNESSIFSSSAPMCDILGVDMISDGMSLTIFEPSYMNNLFDEGEEGGAAAGRYLEVRISHSSPLPVNNYSLALEQIQERIVCHLFGIFLYQLYSNLDPFPMKNLMGTRPIEQGVELMDAKQPAKKKATSDMSFSSSSSKKMTYSVLRDLIVPSNIIILVQNLVESKCDNPSNTQTTYSFIKEASEDLHLLLHEPGRFLFTQSKFEHGKAQLQLRKSKLYGREKEVSAISESFNRVSTGDSEAIFIGGFSGSGKTRLVESVMPLVDIAGGCVLTHKFDPISKGRSLLELVSAFNRLCSLVRSKHSREELRIIVDRLTESFGSDLAMLGKLLPNVYTLLPQLGQYDNQINSQGGNQMNFQSICFILLQFMNAVTSKSHPVMLFLDDLQWSDSAALDVIHHILSNLGPDASCLFVGSYRSNEVSSDHDIYGLIHDLEASKVTTQKLMLEGIKCEDLNTLISDALCVFPRNTRRLSTLVHEKTEGNPFFFLEFLRSLVDRDLISYSLRQETWQWDEGKIGLENITDNVFYLLSSKMNVLRTEVQMALRVLSSFGIKVDEKIVQSLSCTEEYSNIMTGIEEAKSSGYISKIEEPSCCYVFVHDKVREAAYGLISDDERDGFHERLGMALINAFKDDDDDATALTIVCEVNRSLASIKQRSSSVRVKVSSLNYKAGIAAMKRSDYATATSYLDTTLQLLPGNHWESNYSISLQAHMAIAKASYSIGDTDKAQAMLEMIFKHATCMKEKLDAYYLFVNLLHSQERGEEAYTICTELGEKIPDYITPEESKAMVQKTMVLLHDFSEEKLLAMKEMDESVQVVIKFYGFMTLLCYYSKSEMVPYTCLRSVKLTLENGICKYSLNGFVTFAFILCLQMKLATVRIGCKIGAISMSALDRGDYSDIKSRVDLAYNTMIRIHTHPIQKCAEGTFKGFEFGVASGDTVSAFLNAAMYIRFSIIGGSRLPDLLSKTDKYLSLVGHHGHTMTRAYIWTFRQTISTLIDKGENTGRPVNDGESSGITEATYVDRHSETANFHKALQSFWLGYNERCHHYIEKLFDNSKCGRFHRLIATFYYGLNAFSLLRKGQLAASRLKQLPLEALTVLKDAEELSKWNFRNKVFLLEAELYSHRGNKDDARTAYAAAITSARASRFIHEQGLACECAGFHCKRVGDHNQARDFFNQAKICYNQWGSSMKVEFCNRQMNLLENR